MTTSAVPGEGYRAYASEDVVTGEGVEVELPVASTMLRAASGVIDILVAGVLLLAIGWAGALLSAETSAAVQTSLRLVVVVGVLVALPATVETLTRGRTLGKLALGLRVVRDDGGPITSRHAITRALVGFVEIYLLTGIPPLIASVVNARSKRLGDMTAGTYVVTQRSRMRVPPPPPMPAPLAAWASSADVGALPPGLTVSVRQFLARASTLAPASRGPLAEQLLTEVLCHVAPAPPAGIHGEYVLAAVIAERRRRDTQRLAREQTLRDRVLARDPLA